MKRTMRLYGLLLSALLGACGGGSAPGGESGSTPPVDPSTLCVASACGVKTKLLDIPSAENTLFTPDGRLFVSGGSNVYEVTRDSAGYHATPLYDGTCNFTGLARRGAVLYVACFDLRLYALRLDDAAPKLQPIYSFTGVAAPNGMTDGPDGELYLADGPLSSSQLPSPKLVRLDFDPADPLKVSRQTTWLTQGVAPNLMFPNGLTRRGRTLYFTASQVLPPILGSVLTVDINTDGTAGTPHTLTALETSVPDDLSLAGDDLLLALYSEGAIALLGADGGIVTQTDPLSFDLPSSVKLGQPPLFDPTDLVVTEKGVVGVDQTGALFGNKLSVFRRKP